MFTDYLLPAQPVASLDEYIGRGGGKALSAADTLGPEAVCEEVFAAGLRGRGGAGFATGIKWQSVRGGSSIHDDRFVVVNGAEGEPGTFKDRMMLRRNPYQVIEGALIAAFAADAPTVLFALKASFRKELERLESALLEVDAAGWADDITIGVVRGPDSYLFGEETALLEVIEGEDPLPRNIQPYLYGLFSAAPQVGWSAGLDLSSTGPSEPSSNPTLVNNVETMANVPPILVNGADWYRSMGTAESPGSVLCTISGDTVRADVREVQMGHPLGDVIDAVGGGMPPGRSVRAALSGVANPVITAPMLSAPMSYEGLDAAGSAMGAAGFSVFDDTTNMVEVAYSVSRFLYVESCGQCPACKFGTGEVTAYLEHVLSGAATVHDVDVIGARLLSVTDANRCYLPVQERRVIGSILQAFPEDITAHLQGYRGRVDMPIAKIEDIVDGRAVYDYRQMLKRPDWTYAEEFPVSIVHHRR